MNIKELEKTAQIAGNKSKRAAMAHCRKKYLEIAEMDDIKEAKKYMTAKSCALCVRYEDVCCKGCPLIGDYKATCHSEDHPWNRMFFGVLSLERFRHYAIWIAERCKR